MSYGIINKEAYADLFVIKSHPSEKDKALIEGKFKSVHNATDRPAELMAKTFFAVLKLADIDHNPSASPAPEPLNSKSEDSPEPPRSSDRQSGRSVAPPGLHYNIQIHLPATKDVEVYNAIFKSLKEHLIG
jgi:hypothetical protein